MADRNTPYTAKKLWPKFSKILPQTPLNLELSLFKLYYSNFALVPTLHIPKVFVEILAQYLQMRVLFPVVDDVLDVQILTLFQFIHQLILEAKVSEDYIGIEGDAGYKPTQVKC